MFCDILLLFQHKKETKCSKFKFNLSISLTDSPDSGFENPE